MTHMFVPVVDRQQRPLMPTTPARARRWIKTAKATAFWKGGIFCVRLNIEPAARELQPIAVGIDPGSKKEGICGWHDDGEVEPAFTQHWKADHPIGERV